jgi:thiol:disulfide interchange protein DsbD
VAVQLGYRNVYRDPLGFPDWEKLGMPVERRPYGLCDVSSSPQSSCLPESGSLLWIILGAFVGGLALNLTPCVYPLIPITVSYFGGQSGDRGRLTAHALLYVTGLALTNATLGVTAALTGGILGTSLQNPVVLVLLALVLVAFALSLFGLWELRLPGALSRAAGRSYAGYSGSLFMGLTMGLVAAPCIGPFVLGLLTWVAAQGSAWLGFLVFFTLSLGLGLPLFFLALFSGSLDRLPRSGEWMVWVRKLMGWILVGMAIYFLRPVLPESYAMPLLALVALAAGLHLGLIDRTTAHFRFFSWMKTAALAAGLVICTFLVGSWLMKGPGVAWQPYSDRLLQEAQQEDKPVIIDFYATWCTPCLELEDITFHDLEVVKRAGADFVMIKVDLTRKGDPGQERLLSRYGVRGVPTVVFLDRRGQERDDLRLLDYLPPEQMLSRMVTAGKK